MHAWNSRALPARYYKGVASITLRRSKHAWAIKGPLLMSSMRQLLACPLLSLKVPLGINS